MKREDYLQREEADSQGWKLNEILDSDHKTDKDSKDKKSKDLAETVFKNKALAEDNKRTATVKVV